MLKYNRNCGQANARHASILSNFRSLWRTNKSVIFLKENYPFSQTMSHNIGTLSLTFLEHRQADKINSIEHLTWKNLYFVATSNSEIKPDNSYVNDGSVNSRLSM